MSTFGALKVTDFYAAFTKILRLLERPVWSDPRGYLRVLLDATSTTQVGTVSTVTAVTSLSNYAGQNAQYVFLYAVDRTNWGINVRSRIT